MKTVGLNGGLREWWLRLAGGAVLLVAGAALQQSCATRDLVRDMAAEFQIPEGARGIVSNSSRLTGLEEWRKAVDSQLGEGPRFTEEDAAAQAEQFERRCDQLDRRIEGLDAALRRCCGRGYQP